MRKIILLLIFIIIVSSSIFSNLLNDYDSLHNKIAECSSELWAVMELRDTLNNRDLKFAESSYNHIVLQMGDIMHHKDLLRIYYYINGNLKIKIFVKKIIEKNLKLMQESLNDTFEYYDGVLEMKGYIKFKPLLKVVNVHKKLMNEFKMIMKKFK